MSDTLFPAAPLLIVDDEKQFLLSLEFTLNSEGITNTMTCNDSRRVLSILQAEPVSMVLLDLTMPYVKGWELLPQIKADFPEIPVVILTAINEAEMAVECMKNGASDYLVKPVNDARLVTTARRVLELGEVRDENRRLKRQLLSTDLENPHIFEVIITRDPAMRKIFQYLEAIASSPMPILISGETGVGKELIAGAAHRASGKSGKFVPVNIAGVDDQLFSDTLFGHRKGAFTGADRDRSGLIEEAAGGTLFLDEIGDLPLESQVKLLRLLQDGIYYPIGSDRPKTSDARIVLATNADLNALQQNGKFRKDLYYRIQAHEINLPPLRQRKTDIPLLLGFLIDKAAQKLGKKPPAFPKELAILLQNYDFPGNIRELEGMIFNAVSVHKSGVLSMETIKEKIAGKIANHEIESFNSDDLVPGQASADEFAFPEKLPTLKAMEVKLIEEALKRAEGNQSIAAELLGLSRRALNNRLSRSNQ